MSETAAPIVVGTEARTNGLALAGFIVSLSTFVVPLAGLNGIVGAILGGFGLAEARRRERNGLPEPGRGYAVVAIVVGIAATALTWVLIAIVVALLGVLLDLEYAPPPEVSVA